MVVFTQGAEGTYQDHHLCFSFFKKLPIEVFAIRVTILTSCVDRCKECIGLLFFFDIGVNIHNSWMLLLPLVIHLSPSLELPLCKDLTCPILESYCAERLVFLQFMLFDCLIHQFLISMNYKSSFTLSLGHIQEVTSVVVRGDHYVQELLMHEARVNIFKHLLLIVVSKHPLISLTQVYHR